MKKFLIILAAVLSVLCILSSCDAGSSVPGGEGDYHTVSFKTGIDTTVESQRVPDGATATLPDTASFTKEGYEFEGWLLNGDDYDFSTPVVKDIVLVAKWAVKCTVVFFDSDEDTAISEVQIVDYMGLVEKPETPVKAGYSFVKWIEKDRSEYNFKRPVSNTYLELIAVWEANDYTVTYDDNGADVHTCVPSSQTYTYGDTFKAAGIVSSGLSKVGCIFEGWALEEDGEAVYKAGDDVTGQPNNMTLYAVWKDPGYPDQGKWKGPSGGIVIAVNPDYNESSTWKYIELAPKALTSRYSFGYYRLTTGKDKNETVGGTSSSLGKGKENTEALIGKMADTAPIYKDSDVVEIKTSGEEGTKAMDYDAKAVYAAKACYDYELEYEGNTYDDWYLPSEGELFYVRLNHVDTDFYITSTEVDATKCKMILIVNQEINNIQVPAQMKAEEMDKSYSALVLPVRYF